jgi:hypothetical protein
MTETAEIDTPVGGDALRGRKKAKAPPKKNKGGRPSKYIPAYAKVAAQMCKLGATDADLAAAFGVTTVTIWNWQGRYEEFFNALMGQFQSNSGSMIRFGFWSLAPSRTDVRSLNPYWDVQPRASTRAALPA